MIIEEYNFSRQESSCGNEGQSFISIVVLHYHKFRTTYAVDRSSFCALHAFL